jgi:hypothetical protein
MQRRIPRVRAVELFGSQPARVLIVPLTALASHPSVSAVCNTTA